MSVDIAWETFTAGADGAVLSEKIREFMHSKFQTITLPRFIKAVHVHSFEFGSVSPEIEIKDICDPLPDFYDEDDEGTDQDTSSDHNSNHNIGSSIADTDINPFNTSQHKTLGHLSEAAQRNNVLKSLSSQQNQPGENTFSPRPDIPPQGAISSEARGHLFSRIGAPGIPGGTSNLNHFHLPLSGARTPLAAVASGTTFARGPFWHDEYRDPPQQRRRSGHESESYQRHRGSDSFPSPELGSPFNPSSPESRPVNYPVAEKVSDDLTMENLSILPSLQQHSSNPSDLQVVAHVNYDGDVRMTLTAEILLDYPMPSFVGIPLKLSVTGMKFDGVAILAYIKKHLHFCFLDPDDAQTLVGDPAVDQGSERGPGKDSKSSFGGLIREVHVQSEIGRKEEGKQVLKNVGKVEKFILEQVRKIFEEEFVFPSFWTFLV